MRSECIAPILARGHNTCPLCRSVITKETVFPLPPKPAEREEEEEENTEADDLENEAQNQGGAGKDTSHASTKIDALRDILVGLLHKDPTTRIIVFSQWTRFLVRCAFRALSMLTWKDLIEPMLTENGIIFSRFDGSLSKNKRDAAVDSFQNGESHVFLASLKSACFGLNLTAANRVVMMDSWWNPSVEDQAVDRVYRLGQKRDVEIIRLSIKGSIEERVIAGQQAKREMAAKAFGESRGLGKKLKENRLEDLKELV